MDQFAENAHWAEPSPLFAHRARPTPLNCINDYLVYVVLAQVEETAAQAVVGSIVWTFHRLKKPRCQEMSARGYALHSICHQRTLHRISIRIRFYRACGCGFEYGFVKISSNLDSSMFSNPTPRFITYGYLGCNHARRRLTLDG